MDEREKEIRSEIAGALGELSQKIVRRQPPFDLVPLQEEAMAKFYIPFVALEGEMDVASRRDVLRAHMLLTQYLLRDRLLLQEPSFAVQYPLELEIIKRFFEWSLSKRHEQPEKRKFGPPQEIAPIVKAIMQEELPDYAYSRNASAHGWLVFEKDMFGNRGRVIVDRGTRRSFLSFMLGAAWPEFEVDIAVFFGGSQSFYDYDGTVDANLEVRKGVSLVKLLLPSFMEAVFGAIGNGAKGD